MLVSSPLLFFSPTTTKRRRDKKIFDITTTPRKIHDGKKRLITTFRHFAAHYFLCYPYVEMGFHSRCIPHDFGIFCHWNFYFTRHHYTRFNPRGNTGGVPPTKTGKKFHGYLGDRFSKFTKSCRSILWRTTSPPSARSKR